MANVRKFDFTLLHNEFQVFEKLKIEIMRRFKSVNSYHELLNKYHEHICDFQRDWAKIEEEIETLNIAVANDNVD